MKDSLLRNMIKHLPEDSPFRKHGYILSEEKFKKIYPSYETKQVGKAYKEFFVTVEGVKVYCLEGVK